MTAHIDERLTFMMFSDAERAALRSLQPDMDVMMEEGLGRFYSHVRKFPETSAHFTGESQMNRAKGAQARHWKRIATGDFDTAYYDAARKIGRIHATMGLDMRWYAGSYALLLETMFARVQRRCSPWRRLLSGFTLPRPEVAASAIVKAALLDMELCMGVYFEVAEQDRQDTMAALGTTLASLAEGHLDSKLAGLPASFKRLEHFYNDAVQKIAVTITAVNSSVSTIRSNSSEIATATQDLARRTESNAASVEQTNAALASMGERVKATVLAADATVVQANDALSSVRNGSATTEQARTAMDLVAKSAKGIDSVIEGLDKIAFQTRVLAMNAAVEAGRAGDAGRGFAVVADLVSALAMRAEEEAHRAREQLTVTQQQIFTALEAVHQVETAFKSIEVNVDAVNEQIGGLVDDNRAQSQAIAEIGSAMNMMDRSTQQNAAMVEETSAATQGLVGAVEELAEQAATFTIEPSQRRPIPARQAA